MIEDAELLRRYAESRSETAFATLVLRHLDRVYSVALRQVEGDRHLAEDVVQAVFTTVARKAATLAQRPVLGGWLYRTTQYTAVDHVRAEGRRRARETEATVMHDSASDPAASTDWEKLRPVLDQTLAELSDRDRDAVWLRFFEERSFAEVGVKLRLTENGARMRVERALDKLHAALARRGVTSTATALAAALAGQVTLAAPSGLAAVVTTSAIGATTSTTFTTLFTFMTLNKIPLGITSALAVAGGTGVVFQYEANAQLRRELDSLRAETPAIAALQAENARLAAVAAEVARLRADDAEFARLQDEAAALRLRLDHINQAALTNRNDRPVAASTATTPPLDRLPRPNSQATPVYPPDLRRAGVSGRVVVQFVVDANGAVQNPKALSATQPEFEASALEAVSQWRFDPGTKGGQMVNTRLEVPIMFGDAPAEPAVTPAIPAEPTFVRLAPFAVARDTTVTDEGWF